MVSHNSLTSYCSVATHLLERIWLKMGGVNVRGVVSHQQVITVNHDERIGSMGHTELLFIIAI